MITYGKTRAVLSDVLLMLGTEILKERRDESGSMKVLLPLWC